MSAMIGGYVVGFLVIGGTFGQVLSFAWAGLQDRLDAAPGQAG